MPGLRRLFHAAHENSFDHADHSAPVEVVSLRVSASRQPARIAMSPEAAPPHQVTATSSVPLYVKGGWHSAALHRRDVLGAGAGFAGPAIVTQADCTVLVPPGWHARVDGFRNLRLEHGHAH